MVTYDFMRGAWLIVSPAWSIERTCNGFWQVWSSIRFHEYSPGLVTSLLFWMQFYFIVHYRPASEPNTGSVLVPAAVIGLLATAFLFLYFPLVKRSAIQERLLETRLAPTAFFEISRFCVCRATFRAKAR